ncbi:transcriptional regulator, partial [Klebsiella pneumoniae]|nr:transcriptional regulator [Klebsiella pneumoniae]EKV6628248.1 transcriptional regulator [Klebsiella pneumoniae]EKV8537938.1 transcriptional regulator [Klebsiella pneumoniae]EKW8296292.1 transcriptional regulator [Klebsiella pneumoniae]EKW9202351.1 transcriptional regulator [Klebsiella pneumoniae]
QGRTLFCHACYDNLAALIAFLTEECCADEYAPPGFMSPPEKK